MPLTPEQIELIVEMTKATRQLYRAGIGTEVKVDREGNSALMVELILDEDRAKVMAQLEKNSD